MMHSGPSEEVSELDALPVTEVHEIAYQISYGRVEAILICKASLALKHSHDSACPPGTFGVLAFDAPRVEEPPSRPPACRSFRFAPLRRFLL